MHDQRHWLVRFSAELLVAALLATAVVSYRFDLGERWFGLRSADPTTEPAAVLPPEGLRLPGIGKVRAVAGSAQAVAADPARVAATVQPLLRKKALGRHVTMLVTDLTTGRAVYRSGGPTLTPASITKVLTSAAALDSLGPMTRFRTTVRWVPSTRQLVLVGGGDPFLASTAELGASSYPDRADLQTLARLTVRKLRTLEVSRVRLVFDDSAFTGPAVNPAWPDTYIPEDVVPPISALWADEGRDPDGSGFLDQPAEGAAELFRKALRSNGLKVGPSLARDRAPAGATDVASVSSAPVGEIVERTLAASDNQAAEVLARQVGLEEKQEGSFVAGSAAVLEVLRRLGVPVNEGDRLRDGSGLSRSNRLTPDTLTAVLRLSVSPEHPELRQVLTGLPVAGFTGSLKDRFDQGPDRARGRVRAKTGTLTGVHGLAGVAEDAGGARLAFVVVADRVALPKNLEAQERIDRIAAALGACSCGVGSSS